jgi:3-hydroxyisobutyrate dehydrogenase-like beta-hydroxyacid dehydrogenase
LPATVVGAQLSMGSVGMSIVAAELAVASTSLPKKALAGDFSAGIMVQLAHKDVRLALELARSVGVSTPLGNAAFGTLGDARAQGMERDDIFTVLRLREQEAGVEVRLAQIERGQVRPDHKA